MTADADTLSSPRRLLAEALADRLRVLIQSGEIVPGTRLRQAEVAARFRVSTTPVREAFLMLESDGLVRSNAHRGVTVFQPTIADLREVYEMRIALEMLAARLAVPNLTSADLDQLTRLLTKLTKADQRGDSAASQSLNDDFHNSLYAACGRPRLTQTVAELRRTSSGYRRVFTALAFGSRPRDLETTEQEHTRILDACRRGDADAATAATGQHLQHTLDVVQAHLAAQDSVLDVAVP